MAKGHSPLAFTFAVRVIYPHRRGGTGKRDLVVRKQGRVMATAYARKVAGRGFKTSDANRPIACVYDLTNWSTKPECYTVARKTTFGGQRRVGSLNIEKVPYAGLGGLAGRRYRRRRRR